MLNSFQSKLAVVAAVAAGVVALPAGAAADTPPPPLQAGDTQAYASLTAGGPAITSPIVRHHTNQIRLVLYVRQVTCTANLTTTIAPDGTTAVTQATFGTLCSSETEPGCHATMTAPTGTPGMPWGGRLVRDSSGAFRHRINIKKLTVTYGGGCSQVPGGVPLGMSGVISPTVSPSGVVSFDWTSGRFTYDLGDNGLYPYLSGWFSPASGEPLYPRV